MILCFHDIFSITFLISQYKYESRTGKSLSEALLFAEHGENMLCTKIVLNVRKNFCAQHTAIPYRESTGFLQGIPCVVFPPLHALAVYRV